MINPTAPAQPPRHLSFTFGALLFALPCLASLIGIAWTPYDPTAMNLEARLAAASLIHPLGTDSYGRDVLSMMMIGGRAALGGGLIAVGLASLIGVPMGLWAALKGGLIDDLIMRGADVIFAFPALLSAMLLVAALGPGATSVILAIGLFNIPVFARVSRQAARVEAARDYVLAARLIGKSTLRIALSDILPNIQGALWVQTAVQLSLAIVAEAGLAYLGLGIQPPAPSWGRMLSEAQTLYADAPWLVLAPGLAILISVMGLTLLADGARERLAVAQGLIR
jgi:peptide/nickel transport system permease protein